MRWDCHHSQAAYGIALPPHTPHTAWSEQFNDIVAGEMGGGAGEAESEHQVACFFVCCSGVLCHSFSQREGGDGDGDGDGGGGASTSHGGA